MSDKFVQISVESNGESGILYALTESGEVWIRTIWPKLTPWKRIPDDRTEED